MDEDGVEATTIIINVTITRDDPTCKLRVSFRERGLLALILGIPPDPRVVIVAVEVRRICQEDAPEWDRADPRYIILSGVYHLILSARLSPNRLVYVSYDLAPTSDGSKN